MNKQVENEDTLELLKESYTAFQVEPQFHTITKKCVFFIGGCPCVFSDKYDGVWVNTTRCYGGLTIHNNDSHVSIIEFREDILNRVVIDKSNNVVKLVANGGNEEYSITLEDENIKDIVRILPNLFKDADYYDVEKNETDCITTFNLTKKHKV